MTIDTLRADRVGAYGHRAAQTPVMDALARRGARFAQASTAAPLTGPSHATILTGLPPPRHGVRENVTFLLDRRHVGLATRLKRAGYRTAAFVAAYPVAAAFGFGEGFDEFSEGLHPNPGIGQGAERPANEVADAVVAWMERTRGSKDPFFAWVHFYDPHAPYAPPSPYRETFAGSAYDGEVAFADAQLGRILEALRSAEGSAIPWSPCLRITGRGSESTERPATASFCMSRRCGCLSCWRGLGCRRGESSRKR